MSKSQASSFQTNTSINGTGQLSQNVSWNVITTPNQFVVSTPSSMAGPSSDPKRAPVNTSSFPVASSSTRTKSFRKKSRGADDNELSTQTATRFALSLAFDQLSALHPNTDAPFENAVDVVNRLLPYHVFLHPRENLDPVGGIHKGKGKTTSHDLVNEIEETKFALECFKRQKKLEDRFRRARLKSGTRASPDDQAYVLAQAVLEADRTATASLGNELRNVRTEKDRLDREKRVALTHPRPSPYPALSHAQYYRGYPYAYTQPYNGAPSQPTGSPMLGYSSTIPIAPSTNYQLSTASIPVQIPVGSLPALQALGIVPVPAPSLPPADQPQPLAVLRGSTSNGTMLNLEINVSLLQSAQMNGLAIVLNSLMARGGDSAASLSGVGVIPYGATQPPGSNLTAVPDYTYNEGAGGGSGGTGHD